MGLLPGEGPEDAFVELPTSNASIPTRCVHIYTLALYSQSSDSIDADIPAAPSLLLSPDPSSHSQPLSSGSTPGNSALDELDLLGKTLLQQSLPPEGLQVKWSLTQ